MPTDDFSSSQPGQPFPSPGGRVPDRGADELDEATERLESASWERFRSEPRGATTTAEIAAEDDMGPVATFLARQLHERPLPTLLAAVAAGWLVGKLLR